MYIYEFVIRNRGIIYLSMFFVVLILFFLVVYFVVMNVKKLRKIVKLMLNFVVMYFGYKLFFK